MFIKLTEAYLDLHSNLQSMNRDFFVNVKSIDAVASDGNHSQVWISKMRHYCWESVSEVMEKIADAENREDGLTDGYTKPMTYKGD